MEILRNYNLENFNTFGVPAIADLFVEVKSESELEELLKKEEFKNNEKLFLGGGSNVLFTKDFAGIVILNKIKGIEIEKEDGEYVWVKAMSGEVWHDLVEFAVAKDYWGIENLSLIPGTVGAAPMQNIGAYGGELREIMESMEAIDIQTGKKRVFYNAECEFGYRDSIFKNKVKSKYFILSVTFKLSKKEKKNTEYKVLKEYIEQNNIDTSTSKNISDAVATIRRSKLPDPKVTGNAGSFFKNVFVDENKFKELQDMYREMPYFRETLSSEFLPSLKLANFGEGSGERGNINTTSPLAPLHKMERGTIQYKIPAGWLIEQCGWKGKCVGRVGVHDKQALVIVNHGGATGAEIKNLAEQVIDSVYTKFGLKLVPEVNLI